MRSIRHPHTEQMCFSQQQIFILLIGRYLILQNDRSRKNKTYNTWCEVIFLVVLCERDCETLALQEDPDSSLSQVWLLPRLGLLQGLILIKISSNHTTIKTYLLLLLFLWDKWLYCEGYAISEYDISHMDHWTLCHDGPTTRTPSLYHMALSSHTGHYCEENYKSISNSRICCVFLGWKKLIVWQWIIVEVKLSI